MNIISNSYIILGLLILAVILFVISIVKKAFKLLIFALAILIGFSAYNILAKGVSPIDEINGIKLILNMVELLRVIQKIKMSVDNTKSVIEEGKFDSNAIKTIKAENANLHKYQEEVETLKHTQKLNVVHQNYCRYVNSIVDASDGTVKIIDTAGEKNIDAINSLLDKFNATISELSNIKFTETREKN